MVPHDHAGPAGAEVFLAGNNAEAHPGGEGHGEFEGTGGEVLCDTVTTEGPQEEGGKKAVDGAKDKAGVGAEQAGEEGGEGDGEGRESEEERGKSEVEGEEADEEEGKRVHCGRTGRGRSLILDMNIGWWDWWEERLGILDEWKRLLLGDGSYNHILMIKRGCVGVGS